MTLKLIERLVTTMSAPDVAVDQRHTARLYGRFVADLIAKHTTSVVAPASAVSGALAAPPEEARTRTHTHIQGVQAGAPIQEHAEHIIMPSGAQEVPQFYRHPEQQHQQHHLQALMSEDIYWMSMSTVPSHMNYAQHPLPQASFMSALDNALFPMEGPGDIAIGGDPTQFQHDASPQEWLDFGGGMNGLNG